MPTRASELMFVRLALIAALLFPVQAVIGGLQILTQLSGWTQTLHLALGAGAIGLGYLAAGEA